MALSCRPGTTTPPSRTITLKEEDLSTERMTPTTKDYSALPPTFPPTFTMNSHGAGAYFMPTVPTDPNSGTHATMGQAGSNIPADNTNPQPQPAVAQGNSVHHNTMLLNTIISSIYYQPVKVKRNVCHCGRECIA
jgi:hypothetical protein